MDLLFIFVTMHRTFKKSSLKRKAKGKWSICLCWDTGIYTLEYYTSAWFEAHGRSIVKAACFLSATFCSTISTCRRRKFPKDRFAQLQKMAILRQVWLIAHTVNTNTPPSSFAASTHPSLAHTSGGQKAVGLRHQTRFRKKSGQCGLAHRRYGRVAQ